MADVSRGSVGAGRRLRTVFKHIGMDGKKTGLDARGSRLLFACVLITTAAPSMNGDDASGKLTSPSDETTRLVAFEDTLFRADASRDVRLMAHAFAPAARFVHANGLSQSKADYIEATRTDAFGIRDIVALDRHVRISGDLGIVQGVKVIRTREATMFGSYLTAYVRHHGRWEMLWSQSSPASSGGEKR